MSIGNGSAGLARFMADSATTLGLRVASGVVLGLVGIGAALAGGWTFAVLVAVAGLFMAYEWERLYGGTGLGRGALVHAATVLAAVILTAAGQIQWAGLIIFAGGVGAMSFGQGRQRLAAGYGAGVVYTSLAPAAMVWLREVPETGLFAILWVFAVVWVTDVAAYFSGRMIGGPKLAPTISPGKTWAGFAGGTTAAGIAGWLAAWIGGASAVIPLLWAGIAISLVGQGGDLAISKIKRTFRVKDTGAVIPGHGGVLDRLDSLLPTVPLAAAGVYLLQQRGMVWL